jgi:hypothetical protein
MKDVLAIIDAFLADTLHYSLIDADKVHDLLLDVRFLLTEADAALAPA